MIIFTPLSFKRLIPFSTPISYITLFVKRFHALGKLFSSVKVSSELHGSLNVVFTLFSCFVESTQKGHIFIHFSERHILEPEWDEQYLILVAVMEGKWLNKWLSCKTFKRKTENSVGDSGHINLPLFTTFHMIFSVCAALFTKWTSETGFKF